MITGKQIGKEELNSKVPQTKELRIHSALSKFHVATQSLSDLGLPGYRIVFASRTAQVRLIDDKSWETIQRGQFSELPPDVVADYLAIELLCPTDEDELASVTKQNANAEANISTLPLVIQPTAMCQFACDYCGQDHSPKWLNASHQASVLKLVASRLETNHFKKLRIYWFGSEPLAGLSVIRVLTPKLKDVADRFGCDFEAAMVTNGFSLNPEVATDLCQTQGVSEITITLDGTAEFHDSRRKLKTDKPTFERVFSNLIAIAQRKDITTILKVRCNVDSRNADGVIPLLRKLASQGIQQRIQFYMAPIHSWGNDAQRSSLTPVGFASLELRCFVEMVRLGFTIGLLPGRKPVVCVAANPDADVIDATGQIFNCTEVSYVPAYGSPNVWATGHLNNPLEVRRPNVLKLFNTDVSARKWPCADCRMYPVCGGACPKLWHEGFEPCPSAKHNIEGRLLLTAVELAQAHVTVKKNEQATQS